MPPQTRFAKGNGGLIAYQVLGDGPSDLVFMSGSGSQVDVRWDVPRLARSTQRLASFSRLILFDRRGVGASDPISIDESSTWEDWIDDLSVVMDTVGSDRPALLAVADAGPVAMLFAATYPARTRALMLANTSARWRAADDYPIGLSPESSEAMLTTLETWGSEDLAAALVPSIANDARQRAMFAKYTRAAVSPGLFAAYMRLLLAIDLREVLPSISVPTLVIHCADSPLIPVDHGRYLADHIPGARFIGVAGGDIAMPWSPTDAYLDAIEEFVTGARPQPAPDRVLATVLITDLVDSTRRATEIGDRAWREILDEHDRLARIEIEGYGGQLMKSTGDGILATFDAPGRAIRCTIALRDALMKMDLPIRAGLHTGEIERRGDDVGGIAVHIAARVSALAGGGEVVVSRTVSDLVAGSDIRLVDRGLHSLKGVPGEWQLFAVEG